MSGRQCGIRPILARCIGFGTLIAIIGFVVLIGPGVAHGQIDRALQYPPLSIGEDAQPPPPAKMVPQPISPRQVEFRVSGSSLPPLKPPYRIQPNADGSLIAQPGSDLEDAVMRLGAEEVGHEPRL